MHPYRQTLSLRAGPAQVLAALTTAEGLRGWWTEDADVIAPAAGPADRGLDAPAAGHLDVRFGATRKRFRLDRLGPDEVRWHCTAARIAVDGLARADEWVGTDIVFRLVPDGGGTRLVFEHIGLVPALACYPLCDAGWRHFLDSLRQYVDTGRGTPHRHASECLGAAA